MRRRELILAGAALGATVVAVPARAGVAQPGAVLEDLVDRAQILEVAYRSRSDALARLSEPVAEQVEALNGSMEAYGGKRPPLKEIAGRAEQLEGPFLAALQDAVSVLDDGSLLQSLSSMIAASAGRLVELRRAAGRDPIPSAFESGSGTL